MKYYYAGPENNPVGPVDRERLAKLHAVGEISGSTPVIAVGDKDWSTYEAIFPGEGAYSPPPLESVSPKKAKTSLDKRAIYYIKNITTKSSEFDPDPVSELPYILNHQPSDWYKNVAYFTYSGDDDYAALNVITFRSNWCHWDEAKMDGGLELLMRNNQRLTDDAKCTEGVTVMFPYTVLIERALTGLKVRLSSSQSLSDPLVIEVPSYYIQALLFKKFPELFDPVQADVLADADKAEGKNETIFKAEDKVFWVVFGPLFAFYFLYMDHDFYRALLNALIVASVPYVLVWAFRKLMKALA